MSTLPKITNIDSHFLGQDHVIGTYVIQSSEGLIIIDSGPETVFEHYQKAFEKAGLHWRDVKHVVLTHIHFDHAGAAWKFAENGAKIYVHPIGLPHLENPEKLWNSAKQIYKENMDRLWGRMEPIEPELLVPVEDGQILKIGDIEIKAHYTPGHAIHHNAYQIGEVVFTGDVAGVRINNGPAVPPCPPPDINIEAWKKSISKLRSLHPSRLYLAHYGAVDEVDDHLNALEIILDDWAAWIKPYYEAQSAAEEITPSFVQYTQEQLRKRGVSEEDIQRYEKGNPSFMSVTGLLRYWKLKAQGRI